MELNGMPMEGFPSTDLPLGVGIAPVLSTDMGVYPVPALAPDEAKMGGMDDGEMSGLTEAEKEHRIFLNKDANEAVNKNPHPR